MIWLVTSGDALERKLSAIVSADAVGYSRLMAEDEAETIRTLGLYREQIVLLAAQHRGRVVDFTGDNFLAEFPSATAAVESAVEIQRVVAARNAGLPESRRMHFRIGVHLGEVAVEGDRLYGDGVNIAARIEGLAPPGGICVSAAVHDQIKKDPGRSFKALGAQRLKNIPDPMNLFRLESESSVPAVPEAPTRRRISPWLLVAAIGGLLFGVVVFNNLAPEPNPVRPPARFELEIPGQGQLANASFPPIAVSPDGRNIVYAAIRDGASRLFLRSVNRFETIAIPGSEGAVSPFFSPDGRWVGFFATGALYKVRITGGDPIQICNTSNFSYPSAHWGKAGMIRYSRGINVSAGLRQVSENGGDPTQLTKPDFGRGERWHGLAQWLPDGDLLFTVATAEGYRAALLPSGAETWSVLEELGPAVAARYLPSGHLVFGQSGKLMATRWTPDSPTPDQTTLVVDGVHTSRLGLPFFSLSGGGTLVYAAGGIVLTKPVLLDGSGNATPVGNDPGAFQHPRLSPDGRSLAVDITWRGRTDIYVYDLGRGVRRRLTHTGFNIDPLWTPDGTALVFRSTRRGSGGQNIYRVEADGSERPELMLDSELDKVPGSWTRGGSLLAYTDISSRRTMTMGILDLETGVAKPLLDSRYDVGWPVFSPDGRWLAYTSTESGRTEVWVRPFLRKGPALQVTRDGGAEPVWSRDGTQLYFRRGAHFLALEVDPAVGVQPGSARELFRGRFDRSPTGHQHYDVDDRGRFAAVAIENAADPTHLRVVTSWENEVERVIGGGL